MSKLRQSSVNSQSMATLLCYYEASNSTDVCGVLGQVTRGVELMYEILYSHISWSQGECFVSATRGMHTDGPY